MILDISSGSEETLL